MEALPVAIDTGEITLAQQSPRMLAAARFDMNSATQ
jgi:hypothetical protein